MPDLLASTSPLSVTPAIPGRATPGAAPVAASFMALLGDLVLPPGGKPQDGKGQGLAGDGKILPVEGELAGDEIAAGDPLAAWLPAGLVPLPLPDARPSPGAAMVPVAAAPPSGIEDSVGAPIAQARLPIAAPASAEPPTPVTGGTGAASAARSAAAAPAGPAAAAEMHAPAGFASVKTIVAVDGGAALAHMQPAVPTGTAAPVDGATERSRMQAGSDIAPRPAAAHAAALQPVAPGPAVAPSAAQVFAAAISASFNSPAPSAPPTADPAAAQAQAVAAEQLRTTVQAMSGADQPPLDLSRDDWAGRMADRIAALQDAAEAADARIRLAPDHLGNVDISIRREGDRVHVHFAAEIPATRQLLAEAAPRLAELADARGVKLGQTSVDAGAGGQHGAPNQPHANQQPDRFGRPAPAASQGAGPGHDDRIA